MFVKQQYVHFFLAEQALSNNYRHRNKIRINSHCLKGVMNTRFPKFYRNKMYTKLILIKRQISNLFLTFRTEPLTTGLAKL